jgi:hypothetical protein
MKWDDLIDYSALDAADTKESYSNILQHFNIDKVLEKAAGKVYDGDQTLYDKFNFGSVFDYKGLIKHLKGKDATLENESDIYEFSRLRNLMTNQ